MYMYICIPYSVDGLSTAFGDEMVHMKPYMAVCLFDGLHFSEETVDKPTYTTHMSNKQTCYFRSYFFSWIPKLWANELCNTTHPWGKQGNPQFKAYKQHVCLMVHHSMSLVTSAAISGSRILFVVLTYAVIRVATTHYASNISVYDIHLAIVRKSRNLCGWFVWSFHIKYKID